MGVAGVLLAAIATLGVLGLLIGSHPVAPGDALAALRAFDPADPHHTIVRLMRAPRLAVGVLAGLGLGAAGVVVQTMTRNPLAEPGLLGINSGASLAVVCGLVLLRVSSPWAMVALAATGAALAGMVVLTIGGAFASTANPTRLVLAGAATSGVLSALTAVMIINNPSRLLDFRNWDAGALAARPWRLVAAAAVVVGAGLLLAVLASRSLDALALGEDVGRAMGVSVRRAWGLGGASVVLLCGAATALAGPIGFLGLAATIGARRLVGGPMASMVPIAMLLSVCVLLSADLLGRVIAAPVELQTGLVCSLVGAPVFVLLARRSTVVV